MGFSLRPALADIIMTDLEDNRQQSSKASQTPMTDLEDKIIKPLIADDTIKLHSRFVDETLLL